MRASGPGDREIFGYAKTGKFELAISDFSRALELKASLTYALRERGLRFAPDADRRTLIRRVHADLTGLPPTPEEVEAFVADESPDAYERLVDRLPGGKEV